jgi:hypothetical protein
LTEKEWAALEQKILDEKNSAIDEAVKVATIPILVENEGLRFENGELKKLIGEKENASAISIGVTIVFALAVGLAVGLSF